MRKCSLFVALAVFFRFVIIGLFTLSAGQRVCSELCEECEGECSMHSESLPEGGLSEGLGLGVRARPDSGEI